MATVHMIINELTYIYAYMYMYIDLKPPDASIDVIIDDKSYL